MFDIDGDGLLDLWVTDAYSLIRNMNDVQRCLDANHREYVSWGTTSTTMACWTF
jgi:hypothetical protein